MTTTLSNNLPKLRDLVAARTPGDWIVGAKDLSKHTVGPLDDTVAVLDFSYGDDAEFIATMGTIADDLIAVVEAAKDIAANEQIDGTIKWPRQARLSESLDRLESRLTAIFGGETK